MILSANPMDAPGTDVSHKLEKISIPVIDLDQLGCADSRDLVIQDIGEACEKIGCFEVCIV